MDSLNFIFGIRAVNTTSTEGKSNFRNSVVLNSTQVSSQKEGLLMVEYSEEEDITFARLKEQETPEVIF